MDTDLFPCKPGSFEAIRPERCKSGRKLNPGVLEVVVLIFMTKIAFYNAKVFDLSNVG